MTPADPADAATSAATGQRHLEGNPHPIADAAIVLACRDVAADKRGRVAVHYVRVDAGVETVARLDRHASRAPLPQQVGGQFGVDARDFDGDLDPVVRRFGRWYTAHGEVLVP